MRAYMYICQSRGSCPIYIWFFGGVLTWGIGPFRCSASKVRDQTSTHHVGKRQQILRGRNLEENGRQNFEDSSSRGVPKQTTPAPVHVYRILFSFPLAPYQREDPRASGEFFPLPKSQKKIPKWCETNCLQQSNSRNTSSFLTIFKFLNDLWIWQD